MLTTCSRCCRNRRRASPPRFQPSGRSSGVAIAATEGRICYDTAPARARQSMRAIALPARWLSHRRRAAYAWNFRQGPELEFTAVLQLRVAARARRGMRCRARRRPSTQVRRRQGSARFRPAGDARSACASNVGLRWLRGRMPPGVAHATKVTERSRRAAVLVSAAERRPRSGKWRGVGGGIGTSAQASGAGRLAVAGGAAAPQASLLPPWFQTVELWLVHTLPGQAIGCCTRTSCDARGGVHVLVDPVDSGPEGPALVQVRPVRRPCLRGPACS